MLLSVNGEKDTIYKGIKHGACDYIVKPPNIKQLRNIWQHVVRKNQVAVNHSSSDDRDDADQRVVQPEIAEGEHGGAKSKNCSKKKKKNDGHNSDDNRESTRVQTTRKKPRVSWTGELHLRFLEVVNRLGVDKVVPKTIRQMMNVENLSRESVASHLQKYRLYLKRVNDEPKKSEGRKSSCYMDMDQLGGFSQRSTLNNLYAPRHGLSIEPRSRAMGPPVSSFLSSHSDPAYVSVLREKLLEASSVVPTSHPGNSSFAEMPNGGLSEHVNQFPMQPPELISQFSGPMHAAPSAVGDAQFPYVVGNSSNPWQNVASSSLHGPMDGAPLSQSQVNFSQMNQLPSFAASSDQMPMFQQHQMEGIFNNNSTQVFSFSEQQMTPLFDIASNTAPVEMTHDIFSPMTQMVNNVNTSSPLPNLQTGTSAAPPTQMVIGGSVSSAVPDLQDSSVPPTQVLNGRDASSILPVQDGPADQQAPDDQPTYSNFNFLEDIFDSMVHQDFNPDDAFFDGAY